jgi:hypothetical protein
LIKVSSNLVSYSKVIIEERRRNFLLDEFDGVLSEMAESDVLVERRHVIVNVFALGNLEALKLDRMRVVDKRGQ